MFKDDNYIQLKIKTDKVGEYTDLGQKSFWKQKIKQKKRKKG